MPTLRSAILIFSPDFSYALLRRCSLAADDAMIFFHAFSPAAMPLQRYYDAIRQPWMPLLSLRRFR